MKLRDTLYVSFRAVRSEPLQSLLELFAVAIGVALFSISLSLIQFYSRDIDEAAEDIIFRTALVSTSSLADNAASDTAVRVASIESARGFPLPISLLAQLKAESPAVRYAYASVSEDYGYSSGPESATTYLDVCKVTADYFGANDLELAEGSPFVESDYGSGRNVAIMGSELAKRMFPGGSAVGQRITLGSWTSWDVVGVLRPHGDRFMKKGSGYDIDNRLIAPLDPAGTTGDLRLVVEHSSSLDQAASQAQAYFDATLGKSVAHVLSEHGWIESQKRIGIPLFAAISFICGAVLLVIAVNVMSLLLGSVGRRSRSIGLSMALGASRGELFARHLVEFCLTGLSGGAIGIALAAGIAGLIQGLVNPEGTALPGMRLSLQPATAAVSAVLVLGLNLVFGMVPALQATRIRPADAMRME